MQVRLEQGGANAGSEYLQPYFRGTVLDTYDPTTHEWRRTRDPDGATYRAIPEHNGAWPLVPPAQLAPNPPRVMTQHYTLYGSSGGILFAMAPPIALRSGQIRELKQSVRDGTIIGARSHREKLEYETDTPLGDDARLSGCLGLVNTREPIVLLAEPLRSRILTVARAAAGDLPSLEGPFAGAPTADQWDRIASRFQAYLCANYRYSIETRQVEPGLDPTVDFLKNRQTIGGHCEYFASAMVMMCASVGIPARIVTGYHGGEFNTLGGFYTVRQKFAHAWVEVFIPGRGWVTYDPSPAAPNAAGGAGSWRRWIQEFYEVIDHNWSSGVVAFDNSSRHWLGEQLLGPVRRFGGSLRQWLGSVTDAVWARLFAPSTPWLLRVILLAGLGLCGAGGVFLLQYWRRVRRSEVRRLVRGLDRAVQRKLTADLGFFDAFMRLLRSSGVRREPHQTPREYVDAVGRSKPKSYVPAGWLVNTFYDLRFGAVSMSPPLRREIDQTLAALRGTLRTGR